MGTVRRPAFTKPLPKSARIVRRGDEEWAVWTGRGGAKREAPLAPADSAGGGARRIRVEGRTFVGRFRDAAGVWQERSTGCTTRDGAIAVLARWERVEQRISAGVVDRVELDAAAWMLVPIAQALDDYLAAPIQGRKGAARTPRHVANTKAAVLRMTDECSWRCLRDVNAEDARVWVQLRAQQGLSPRRIEAILGSMRSMVRWARSTGRMLGEPLLGVQAPKHQDKRKPRALSYEEIEALLEAAKARPMHDARLIRRGERKGQLLARVTPERQVELEALGARRRLAYRVLLLTGLRASELASVTVGDVELTPTCPSIHLDGARTKNGEPARVPLRADLAAEVGQRVAGLLEAHRARLRASDEPLPLALPPETPLVQVPTLKAFDADLKLAGISKLDARKRTACRHSLRHSGITHLEALGAPASVVSAWARHKGGTLAQRVYTDAALLGVREWLDRLPGFGGEPSPRESGAGDLLATGTDGQADAQTDPAKAYPKASHGRDHDRPLEPTRAHELGKLLPMARNPQVPNSASKPGLALVGERGLEPPTRSTQSYASTN